MSGEHNNRFKTVDERNINVASANPIGGLGDGHNC